MDWIRNGVLSPFLIARRGVSMGRKKIKYTALVDMYLDNLEKAFIRDGSEVVNIAMDTETNLIFLTYENSKKERRIVILEPGGMVFNHRMELEGVADRDIYSKIYDFLEVDRLFG